MGWFSHVTSSAWHTVSSPVRRVVSPVVHHVVSPVVHKVVSIPSRVGKPIAHALGGVAGKVYHSSSRIVNRVVIPAVSTVAKGVVDGTKTIYKDARNLVQSNSLGSLSKNIGKTIGDVANSPMMWVGLGVGALVLMNRR